ncbi:MAG: hypothetical protein E7Z89_02910 [Cyanobacteria bacterium SIG28]|nr:hypothetical protein [Cyanobacteria bacterium SIG28]
MMQISEMKSCVYSSNNTSFKRRSVTLSAKNLPDLLTLKKKKKFSEKFKNAVLGFTGFIGGLFASKEIKISNTNNDSNKPLNEKQFLELKEKVKDKINNLPDDFKYQYMVRISQERFINKHNIRLLDKIVSDKNLYSNGFIPSVLDCCDDEHKANLFGFILDNYSLIKKDKHLYSHTNEIVRNVNGKENAELKKELIKDVLEKNIFNDCEYTKNIIINANSKQEATEYYNFCEEFGVTPENKKDWIKIYGKKKTDNMLKGLKELKQTYQIKFRDLSSITLNRKSEHILMHETKNDLYFRFDINDGSLISVSNNCCKFNLKDKEITYINNPNIKFDNFAMPGEAEKLIGGCITRSDLDGNILENICFNKLPNGTQFKISEIGKNGKKYKIGIVEHDKNGGLHIENHLTSPDKTVTDFLYYEDKDGNYILNQKITDSKGIVLSNTKKTFKKISDNHHISSANGQYYETLITDKEIIVTKLDKDKQKTDEIVKYQIKDLSTSDKVAIENYLYQMSEEDVKKIQDKEKGSGDFLVENNIIEPYIIDKKLIPTIKNLSGSEWFNLKKANVYGIIASSSDTGCGGSSYFRFISCDKNNKSLEGLSILLHEIGHEKFDYLDLENDEELIKIFQEEKNIAETKLTDLELTQISYFLQGKNNGLSELGAEANLIINNIQNWKNSYSRTLILQKNFPRTIAYIQNKYENS